MITRKDVVAHLERGVRVNFLKGQKQAVSRRSPFTRETNSDGAFEQYADMGATPWPKSNSGQPMPGGPTQDGRTGASETGGLHEGGAITVLGGNERAKIVYNRGWDIPIGIYHDAINDNRVGSLEQWAQSAGSRFEQHKDYLAFNALNTGESFVYGGAYNGLPYFSDSHIDPGAQYQTAQSNLYTLPLSNDATGLDNYETVKVAASKLMDDRGVPVGFMHNLLIVATDLERVAAQIAFNREAMGTANRDINPYAGATQVVVAPGGWLDSTAWFVADASTESLKPLILQNRMAPRLYFWDDHTQGGGVRYYKWYARYEVTYADWRNCVQGNT